MGFQIAELFVDITLRGASFSAGLAGIHSSLMRFGSSLDRIGRLAERFLLAAGVAAGFSVREWAKAEDGQAQFAAALEMVGMTYDKVQYQEEAFFEKIQEAYTLQKSDVRDLATLTLKFGAAFGDVNKIVEAGIGLGDRYFGGDSAAGVRALTLAQQGQFRSLQLIIPELKTAKTSQEALTIVMAKAAEGLKLSSAHANSLEGTFKRLWVNVSNLGQSIGQLLSPQVQRLSDFLSRAVLFVDHMSASQKQWALSLIEVAAGVAGVLAIAPKLLSVFSALWQAGQAVVSVVLNVGKTLFAIITGPIGGFVVAIGVAAAALALLWGTGDTLQERLGSGFQTILQMANLFLGGWKNMQLSMAIVTTTTAGNILNAWERLKDGWNTTWSYMSQTVDLGTTGIGLVIANAEESIIATWDSLFIGMRATWMAFWQFINGDFSGAKVTYDKGNADVDDRFALARKALAGNMDAAQGMADSSAEAARAQRLAGGTAANNAIDENNKIVEDRIAALGEELKKLPTFTDGLQHLIDGVKKGMGMDEFSKKLEELMKQFKDIKLDPGKMPELDPSLKLADTAKQRGGGPPTFQFKNIADAFKENLAAALMGDQLRGAETIPQKQLTEQFKQTKHLAKVERTLVQIAEDGIGGAMI